jgi:hypothetical protein
MGEEGSKVFLCAARCWRMLSVVEAFLPPLTPTIAPPGQQLRSEAASSIQSALSDVCKVGSDDGNAEAVIVALWC